MSKVMTRMNDVINVAFKGVHLFWIIASFIFILGGNYFLTRSQIEAHEKRLCEIEDWKKEHMIYTKDVYNDVVIELKQIKLNLNSICKKLNIEPMTVPDVNMVKP